MSLIELACHSKECAPPPVGSGGSDSGKVGGAVYQIVDLTRADDPVRLLVGAEVAGVPKGAKVKKGDHVLIDVPTTDTDRLFVSLAAKHAKDPKRSEALSDEGQQGVGNVVRATQQALKDDGHTHIVLYRGADIEEGANPFARESSTVSPEGWGVVPSGITSWTTDPEIAAKYAHRGKVTKAVVPIEQIVSYDLVGVMSMGARIKGRGQRSVFGNEVLVSDDPKIVAKLVKSGITASALIELACHDTSCAPPPVGRGGSLPGIVRGGVLVDPLGKKANEGLHKPSNDPSMSWHERMADHNIFWRQKIAQVGALPLKIPKGAKVIDGKVDIGLRMSADWDSSLRSDLSEAAKTGVVPERVARSVQETQQALRDSGYTHVVLYRAYSGDESTDPFSSQTGNWSGSGGRPSNITSWTTEPHIALESSEGENVRIVKALVPIEHIVSYETVGGMSRNWDYKPRGDEYDGEFDALSSEILVARDPATVTMLVNGGSTTASATIELACYGKVCAPPPVGRGGSVKGGPGGYHMAVAGEQWAKSQSPEAALLSVLPNAKVHVYEGAEVAPALYVSMAKGMEAFPAEVRASIKNVIVGVPNDMGAGLAAYGDSFRASFLIEGASNEKAPALLVSAALSKPGALESLSGPTVTGRVALDSALKGNVERTSEALLSLHAATTDDQLVRLAVAHEMGHATELLMLRKQIAAEGLDAVEQRTLQRRQTDIFRDDHNPDLTPEFHLMTTQWRETGWPLWSGGAMSGDRRIMTTYGNSHVAESFAEGMALAAVGHPLGAAFIKAVGEHKYGFDVSAVLNSVPVPPIPTPGQTASALVELACHDASCAPPPVGKGGSAPGAGATQFVKVMNDTPERDALWDTPDPWLDEVPVIPEDVVRWVASSKVLPEVEGSDPGFVVNPQHTQWMAQDMVSKIDLGITPDPEQQAELWRHLTRTYNGRAMLSNALHDGVRSPEELRLYQMVHDHFLHMADRLGYGDEVPLERMAGTSSPFAPTRWKADSAQPDQPGTGFVSFFRENAMPLIAKPGTPGAVKKVETLSDGTTRETWFTSTPTPVKDLPRIKDEPHPNWQPGNPHYDAGSRYTGKLPREDILGRMGDMHEELIAAAPGRVQEFLRTGKPVVKKRKRLHASATIELACHDAYCAPPPVGHGGSSPSGNGAQWTVVSTAGNRDPITTALEAQVEVPTGAKVLEFKPGPLQRVVVSTPDSGTTLRGSRYNFSETLKGNKPEHQQEVADIASLTLESLKEAGYTHVVLYRGVNAKGDDPFGRSSSEYTKNEKARGEQSGVTSWSMHPGTTLTYSEGQVVKAVVPIEQVVSFDMVGAVSHGTGAAERLARYKPGDPNHDPRRDASYHPTKPGVVTVPVLGNEVLVANSAETASNIRDHGTSLAASAMIELACHDASCAPPPVGTGGSSPSAKYPGMRPMQPEDAEWLAAKGIKIPPAWTDVHVSENRNAHLLVRAMHKDGKGNPDPRYLYSREHEYLAAYSKFKRVKELHNHIDSLDAGISAHAMTDPDAAALLLIRHFGMRPGSTTDTGAKKKAYGATTLQARHVRQYPGTGRTTLSFIGKGGKKITVTTRDPEVYKVVEAHLAGKQGTDRLFDTSPARVQTLMRQFVPEQFKLKDLRTYRANAIAMDLVSRMRKPKTLAEYRKKRAKVADEVAEALGNTRAIALGSYIDTVVPPTVFQAWEEALGVEP